MEVRPGYKQTEVGVIPEDWQLTSLAKISSFITKGSTPTTYGFKWETSGVLFLRSECVSDHGLDLTQSMLISEEAHAAFHRSQVKLDDILMTITGNVGRVIIFEGADCANLNQHIARIRITAPHADPHYVFFWLSQPEIRSYFSSITTGQAYPQISLQQVRNAEIPLPPLPEQRAIASALSDVDALLAGLDRLIAKKRDLKQAAMQQLLTGQTRLPGFEGEWEVKRLGEIAKMESGGTPLSTKAEFYDGDIPWVSISDMTKAGKFIKTTEKTLTSLGLANSSAKMFPANTVLYAMYASIGECSIAGISVCTSQAILGICPSNQMCTEFIYYFLKSIKDKVKTFGQQGTQSNLNKGIVENFSLGLPRLEEQTAIAAVLSDMDAELSALEARREKTRDLKKAMMQELLTGKTRLI